MNTKPVLLTAFLFALAACEKPAPPPPPAPAPKVATPTPPPPAKGCTANCTVQVKVDGDAKSCTITAPGKGDEYHMGKGKNSVKWHLTGPKDYEFDDQKGISFVATQNPFSKKGVSKLDFEYDDENAASAPPTKYEYHIHVRSADGKVTCKLDPYIIND